MNTFVLNSKLDKMNLRLITFFILFSSCNFYASQNTYEVERCVYTNDLEQYHFIRDYENVFSESFKDDLDSILKNYYEKTNRKVIVATLVKNEILNENNFNEIALDYANYSDSDENGLVIVFCKQLRMIRICTGKVTETILTDDIFDRILTETIIPLFKQDDYKSGIINGINEFFNHWH